MKKITIAATLAVASIVSANAASIIGLANTGSFASGAQDTNYALAGAAGTGFGYVSDNSWPVGSAWMANTTISKWITPKSQPGDTVVPGVSTWTLAFNLTGYDAATAAFTGQFAADNYATVSLNGTNIGTSVGFTNFSTFQASSGFNAGQNTLVFTLTNYAGDSWNPAGLRVEYLSSTVAAVPEPETYAILLAGLGMIGVVVTRRKAKEA
jgi:hypothetical protein